MGANASTAVPLYAAGQVLDAARLNLTNAGIPVFSGTATRDAAFGGSGEKVLAEGQFAYLEDTNALQFYDSAAWQAVAGAKLAQVVSTTKTDTFTSTSTTYTDITGLSASITPTSTSSKVLIFYYVNGSGDPAVADAMLQLVKDSTAIGNGAAAGSRSVGSGFLNGSTAGIFCVAAIYLDSPATTSATTYKIQGKLLSGVASFYINRSKADTDTVNYGRLSSGITVVEVLS